VAFSGLPSFAAWFVATGVAAFAADGGRPVDTQPAGQPLPAREAAGRIKVPAGFRVTLAAAEPEVRQPIAIAYDDRGRLWVAECYSYAGSNFTDAPRDRILILEDADGDGVFESRKVFTDNLNRLTGLATGFGGVWIAAAPHLAFIPDRDGDDTPDGPPVGQLDGWALEAEHNSVNGLTWGPDGWLYGRHGIKKSSFVGAPGTDAAQRTEVGCAIWRFHPTRRRFEVVADGTINPWGLDFDDYGQGFATTSVVDHFWHVIPGARWERWKDRGGHPDPYSYELMSAANDHLHWGGGSWDKDGRIARSNDELGGGHSHSDAMIYLGDRWPREFRGSVLMSNIHGRRINRDVIGRRPGGPYVATHAADFITVDDPWFRAISLAYGPDGDVVMTDWSDHGECHDRDGVHRSSGRIYKISWGAPTRVRVDLGHESDAALVALQLHANDWYVRHARRLLQEKAAAGQAMPAVHAALRRMCAEEVSIPRKLRARWGLHVTNGAEPAWLSELLSHADEHVRHWAVRLMMDAAVDVRAIEALERLAGTESSWLVRMALASALQRIEPGKRLGVAQVLVGRSSGEGDPNLARMIWYGLQPEVATQPEKNASIGLASGLPMLRRFTARRLAAAMPNDPRAGEALLAGIGAAPDRVALADLLSGAVEGLKGLGTVAAPRGAPTRLEPLRRASEPAVRRGATLLAATFGDADAIAALRRELTDPGAVVAHREQALAKLAELRLAWLPADLIALLRAGEMIDAVLRALAGSADDRVTDAILTALPSMIPATRGIAIDALVSRVESARRLLDQIALGKIERKVIGASHARRITQLRDPALTAQLENVWGAVGQSRAATAATIARLKHQLAPAMLLEANLANGAVLFDQSCAACHRLFRRGQNFGPDLTGSGRKDLDYLLLNIVEPSASVPADYRVASLTLTDGRNVSGAIASQTDDVFVLRIPGAETTVKRVEVKSVEFLPVSLMPPGLLEALTATELRDLIGYLMSDSDPAPGRTP